MFRNSKSGTPNKRLKGAGRPLKDKEFDEGLIEWVRQQRGKKFRVSRTMIQNRAKSTSTDEEFKVSSIFLMFYFQSRQAMVGWKNSCIVTIWSIDVRPRLAKSLRSIISKFSSITSFTFRKMRQKQSYSFILAADETAVFIDASNGSTVDLKGVKEVRF